MPILSKESLVSRIRSHQKSAAAKAASNDGSGESDNRDRGTVTPPLADGDRPDKTGLPNQSKPDNTKGVADGATNETKPGGAGENVPSPSKTVKPDEMPLDKAAARVKAITDNLRKVAVQQANTPAATPAANTPAAGKSANTATADDVALTDEFHRKIASALMATEEGRTLVRDYLVTRAGVEAAEDLVKGACAMQERFVALQERQQALVKAAEAQQQQEQIALEQLLKSASAEDRAVIEKIASAHQSALARIEDPMLQAHYKQGALDAGMMQQSMEGGGEPALPGAEEGPASLEQIAQLLAAMVQSGEIDPQTAQAVMAELAGGGEGGGAGGGAVEGTPADAGSADAAPKEPDGDEGAKAASISKLVPDANLVFAR